MMKHQSVPTHSNAVNHRRSLDIILRVFMQWNSLDAVFMFDFHFWWKFLFCQQHILFSWLRPTTREMQREQSSHREQADAAVRDHQWCSITVSHTLWDGW